MGTAPRVDRLRPALPVGPAPETTQPQATVAPAMPDAATAPVPVPRPARTEPDLTRQIGQMLMAGFEGTSVDAPGARTLARQIARGQVGGVLFLGQNIDTRAKVKSLNAFFAKAAGPVPLLLAIDQEGGRIQRLTSRHGFPDTPSARWIARNLDTGAARDAYLTMAGGLAALGFNTNFGPVLDLDVNRSNPIIGALGRAYSADPTTVSDFGRAFVDAHRSAGLVTSIKHFPGHGSSKLDSHKALPDISATWSARELEPFRDLIADGRADTVMIGHLALADYTRSGGRLLPATLSREVVTGLLRDRLGFDGVIVSDDFDMAAIKENFPLRRAVTGAVRAGIDVLIVSNFVTRDPALPEKIVAILAAEAERDPAFLALIEASNRRIARLKRQRLGAAAGTD